MLRRQFLEARVARQGEETFLMAPEKVLKGLEGGPMPLGVRLAKTENEGNKLRGKSLGTNK